MPGKPDKLSQHAKCRQATPACTTKDTVYKGLLEPRVVDKQWTSKNNKTTNKLWESAEPNTTTLQDARQGIRC